MGGERAFTDEKIVAGPELDSISGARGPMIVLDDSVATTRSPVPTTRRASASRGAKRPRRAAIRNPARATRAASARAAGFSLGTSDQIFWAAKSRGGRRKRAFARGEQAQVPANDRTRSPAKGSRGTKIRPTAGPQHATQLQRRALACRGRRPRNSRSSCSRGAQRTSRAAARINELPHVGCRRGFVGRGRSVAPRSAAQIARTHARLDNPFSISSYRPNCCEIAPGEGRRVLGFSTGERTTIFTSLTSPR